MSEGNGQLPFAVAIPSYRRSESLLKVIDDVLSQCPAPAEILVIDQTGTHDSATQGRLREWQERGTIRWLEQEQPNLPAARNRALAETRCPILVFLDDDVRLYPGCLAAHLRNFADPAVVAVTGRVKQPPDTMPRPRLRPVSEDSRYLDFNFDGEHRRIGLARVSGCNHSVRVEAIRQLGGYDERYAAGFCEDLDIGVRIYRAGGLIIYDPEAVTEHLLRLEGGSRLSVGRDAETLLEERMHHFSYFLFKNFFPRAHFWSRFLYRHPRRFVVNRAGLRQPWKLPARLYRYLRAAWRAFHLSRHESRSSP